MASSPLEGAPKCNEKLPTGTPEEIYHFHQFMPIQMVTDGRMRPVGIPMEVANPVFVADVKKRFGSAANGILAAVRKDVAPLEQGWSNVTVAAPPMAKEILVKDVAAALVAGKIEDGGKSYDISELDAVKQALREGQVVLASIPVDNVPTDVKLIPLATSGCDVPERVTLDQRSFDGLIKGEKLVLPRTGAVDLAVTAAMGEKLARDGFVTVPLKIGTTTRELLIETGASAEPVAEPIRTRMPPVGTTATVRPADTRPPSFDFLNPAFILYAPIVQRWTSQGYERGSMLNTFSLAPQEQMTVEVFSWDRRKQSSESSASRESEASAEQSFSRKATSEIVDSASNSNGWQLGVQAGFQVPQIGLNVGANFGIDNRNQTSQTNTLQNISEGVAKVASSVKSSVQTKVTEAREFGTEERITRKFQNPNVGRVLHFDCFEVLHRYSVKTEYDFARAKLCLLVPCVDFLKALDNPSTSSRAAALLGLEGLLFDAVPPRLQSGFDAARQYLAWERICQFSCDSACDCSPPAPPPVTPGAAAAGNPYQADLDAALVALKTAIDRLRGASGQPLARVLGIPADPPPYVARSDEDKFNRRLDFQAFLFRKIVLEDAMSGFWSGCLGFSAQPDIRSLQTLRDRLTPSIASMINPAFAFGSLGLAIVRHTMESIVDFGLNLPFLLPFVGFDDMGLQTTTTRALAIYGEWQKVEDEKKKPPTPPENAAEAAPEEKKRERRSDDEAYSPEALAVISVNIEALAGYLLINRSAYRALIWSMLNPEDRVRYIKAFGNIDRFVLPNVLGFVGDDMAIEVQALDAIEASEWLAKRLGDWKIDAVLENDVLLPVPGMTMQTRVEGCDALEPYLTKSREAELARLEFVAQQQEQELARLKQRLDKGMLDDPKPTAATVRVETVTPEKN
ncbi:MAG: hypothetical protein J0H88_03360 [Sphingomonadales bacterium]|nr:hypothetical protein [Sphingomonadales bacterium]